MNSQAILKDVKSCLSNIDQKRNLYSYNEMPVPVRYFINETFSKKNSLNMA
jgi:hypothetical protein